MLRSPLGMLKLQNNYSVDVERPRIPNLVLNNGPDGEWSRKGREGESSRGPKTNKQKKLSGFATGCRKPNKKKTRTKCLGRTHTIRVG